MRMLAIVVIVLGLYAGNAAAQKRHTTHHHAKPKPASRELFDPKRNPKADLEAAIAKATAQHKRIILDVGGEWCDWCRYMDKFFAAHPILSRSRDANYIWVKINYSDENENKAFLSLYPEIGGYPQLFVLDSDGKLLKSQDTSEFERNDVYMADVILKFLNDWAPRTDAH